MNCLSYTNNHTAFTKKIPVPLQRLMMKEYCQRNQLIPKFDHNEIFTFEHMPILHHIVETEKNADFILFSVFSMPENEEERREVITKGIESGIKFHFSNEDIVVSSLNDFKLFNDTFAFLAEHDGNMF